MLDFRWVPYPQEATMIVRYESKDDAEKTLGQVLSGNGFELEGQLYIKLQGVDARQPDLVQVINTRNAFLEYKYPNTVVIERDIVIQVKV